MGNPPSCALQWVLCYRYRVVRRQQRTLWQKERHTRIPSLSGKVTFMRAGRMGKRARARSDARPSPSTSCRASRPASSSAPTTSGPASPGPPPGEHTRADADGQCYAGFLSPVSNFAPKDWHEATNVCAAEGKVLCGVEQPCMNKGCHYNGHYQWTGEECQAGDAGLPAACAAA